MQMLHWTCGEAGAVEGASVELCLAPAAGQPLPDAPVPEGVDVVTDQGSGDLGARLARAAERVLARGEHIIMIGTDCPALGRDRLRGARDTLAHHEAFIHPAEDGGYALLALRRYSPLLFSAIEWSGPCVGAETIARLEALGWSYAVGDVLRDIDEPADFEAHFGPQKLPGAC